MAPEASGRPASIVAFERAYLAAIAVGMAGTALNWRHAMAAPAVRQAEALIGAWYVPATVIGGVVLQLALWYAVARRGSVVAKWIVVAFAALALITRVVGLAMGTVASPLGTALGFVALVLALYAASRLFRADAERWFGEKEDAA